MLFPISKTFLVAFIVGTVYAAPEPRIEERQLGSIIDGATSIIGGGATSIIADITSVGGGVFQTVTSVGGKAVTVVTSAGGQAITLAGDGAGAVTSFAGSQYTVATAAVQSAASDAARNNNRAASLDLPFIGLFTVVGGALVGALLTV